MVVCLSLRPAQAANFDFLASSTITHYVHGTQGRLGRTLGATEFRFSLAPSVPGSAHKRPVVRSVGGLPTWLGIVVGMCGTDLFGTLWLSEASCVMANALSVHECKPLDRTADVQSDVEAGELFGLAFRCSKKHWSFLRDSCVVY